MPERPRSCAGVQARSKVNEEQAVLAVVRMQRDRIEFLQKELRMLSQNYVSARRTLPPSLRCTFRARGPRPSHVSRLLWLTASELGRVTVWARTARAIALVTAVCVAKSLILPTTFCMYVHEDGIPLTLLHRSHCVQDSGADGC